MTTLAEAVRPSKGRPSMRSVYEALSEDDRLTFDDILFDPAYTDRDLTNGLRALGHDVTFNQVRNFASEMRRERGANESR